MTTNTSAGWDQRAFEQCDRRGARKARALESRQGHDLLHLATEPASRQLVGETVRKHCRHTDSVHAHGDALVVSCAPGDAAGLRKKLELILAAEHAGIAMSHDTFPAGSDITHNVAGLKGG